MISERNAQVWPVAHFSDEVRHIQSSTNVEVRLVEFAEELKGVAARPVRNVEVSWHPETIVNVCARISPCNRTIRKQKHPRKSAGVPGCRSSRLGLLCSRLANFHFFRLANDVGIADGRQNGMR